MSLSPEEIAGQQFTVGLRGYDQDEVRAFLELVAAELADSAPSPAADPDAGLSESAATTQATAILEKARSEAAEVRQSASAEAEIVRSRARAVLAAAQEEALRLVAETHVRIDRRFGAASGEAAGGTEAPADTVEQVGAQISAMVKARDEVLRQLHEVREQVDAAVEAAEADPVLGRRSAPVAS